MGLIPLIPVHIRVRLRAVEISRIMLVRRWDEVAVVLVVASVGAVLAVTAILIPVVLIVNLRVGRVVQSRPWG